MAFTTAAAIAGLASAGIGIGKQLFGGNGQQQQAFDTLAGQLAQSNANAQNANRSAALAGQLGRAGFTDSSGNSLRYDPATDQWVSTLGALPQQAQTASDQATIARNTTDLRQAQGANERADLNAARAQPLISAAMMRLSQFKPQTTDELSGLLQESAVNANNAVYRPLVADTLRQFARTGTSAGPVLADIGRRSSADLRQAMIDSRVAGLQNVEQVNNSRRQGLQSDLGTAIAAGTPQFQYPQIASNNPQKDMLAAIVARSGNAGLTQAVATNAATSAANAGNQLAGANAGATPDPLAGLTGASTGFDSLSKLLQDKKVQQGLGSAGGFISNTLFPGGTQAFGNNTNILNSRVTEPGLGSGGIF